MTAVAPPQATVSGVAYLRWWVCERKQVWQSQYVAGNVATALGWKGLGRMEPYRCPFCALWHVGHPVSAARRRYIVRRAQEITT